MDRRNGRGRAKGDRREGAPYKKNDYRPGNPRREPWDAMGTGPRKARPVKSPVPPARRVDGPQDTRAPRPQAPSARRVENPLDTRAPRTQAPYVRRVENPQDTRAPRPQAPYARRVENPLDTRAPRTQAPPENILAGRNPIREALRSGRPIDKLVVANGEISGSAREIVALAREKGILVQYADKVRLDEVYEKHQGMIAYCAAAQYVQIEDILRRAEEKGEAPFVVLLDGITDPHNLGAIIRTAECAGAHGVIIPQRRSAALNPAANKAAAGALEYLPVARVTNIVRALEELKRAGLWVVGGTMDGEEAFAFDFSGPIALVIGAEGDGISKLVKETLDKSVTIPVFGRIDSLNASVAAGVLMYGIAAARRG